MRKRLPDFGRRCLSRHAVHGWHDPDDRIDPQNPDERRKSTDWHNTTQKNTYGWIILPNRTGAWAGDGDCGSSNG
jgi:hypothetical protein